MPQDMQQLCHALRTAGLRVREQDVERLSRWAAERIRALAIPGIEQYCQLLAEDNTAARCERERLTVQCSTGESYFFRDQGQFDLLAGTILPELIAQRSPDRRLCIWSAGCAAGEEAYTLAMLLDEMTPRLAGWDIRIVGSDIDTAALERARRGLYRDWSFRALDVARRQRYFQRCGDQWRIDGRLRDMVTFRRDDLVRDRFPNLEAGLIAVDLILCRNVFIYLDAQAVARITAKFAATLADGGYLVTAHSELFGHEIAPLRVRMFPQSVVFQKTKRPAAAIGLGDAWVQTPTTPAPPPPTAIEGPTSRIVQRALPAKPRGAPADDCDRLMQAAWRHADRGMPDAAEHECRRAIALSAFDPRPYYLLAQLAQERGDAMQAKSLLKKVIYLDPSFIAAYLEIGALNAYAGNLELARRMYDTARKALSKLPATAVVAPYGESTAADILAYVERMLAAPAGEIAASARAEARSHQGA